MPNKKLERLQKQYEFKLKYCQQFTKRRVNEGKDNDKLCICGRNEDFHGKPQSGSHVRQYVTKLTNCLGKIDFAGESARSAKIVRISDETDVEKIIKFLTDEWQIQKPELIIDVSVNHDAIEEKSGTEPLSKIFCEGVIRACRSSRAWVITDGIYSPVWDAAERVMLEEPTVRPVILGITHWGSIFNSYDPSLDQSNECKRLHATPYAPKFKSSQTSPFLDHHHSHFLLVDDGNLKVLERESTMIKDFKDKLILKIKKEYDVPIVKVNCMFKDEGVKGRTVTYEDFPLLQVEIERNEIRLKLKPELVKDPSSRATMEEHSEVEDEGQNEDGEALDKLILTAAFVENNSELFKKCLQWNRKDVAEDWIRTLLDEQERDETVEMLSTLFEDALYADNVTFVKFCLKFGFDMGAYLTKQKFVYLYNHKNSHEDIDLEFKKQFLTRDTFLLRYYDIKVIEDFLCFHEVRRLFIDIFKLKGSSERYQVFNAEQVNSPHNVQELLEDILGHLYSPPEECDEQSNQAEVHTFKQKCNTIKQAHHFERPAKELFIWAILKRKFRVAEYLFCYLDNCTAAALFTVNIARNIAEMPIPGEVKKEYRAVAAAYEELATDILSRCEQAESREDSIREEHKTDYMLLRRQDHFGRRTCFNLAFEGQCLEFLSHDKAQLVMDKIWRGRISMECSGWKIMLCMASLGLPLCFSGSLSLIQFRENVPDYEADCKIDNEENDNFRKRYLDIDQLSMRHRFLHFFTAPIVVFGYNFVFYLIFLALYSHTVLSRLGREESPEEWTIFVWVLSFLCEEIRQLIKLRAAYIRRRENFLDQLGVWSFIVGFIIRRARPTTVENALALIVARYFIYVSLIFFYFRLLHFFFVFKKLGPILTMIGRMTVDLLYFLLLMAVFFFAFGVVVRALVYVESPDSIELFWAVVRTAYWQTHGEVATFLDEYGNDTCGINKTDGTLTGCSHSQLAAPMLMGVYGVFINILMVNILIAMFSDRYRQVSDHAQKYWCYQRYFVIREFLNRPLLPPPFILFLHAVQFSQLLMWFITCACGCRVSCGKKMIDTKALKQCVHYRWPWDCDIYLVFAGTKHRMMEEQVTRFERTHADISKPKISKQATGERENVKTETENTGIREEITEAMKNAAEQYSVENDSLRQSPSDGSYKKMNPFRFVKNLLVVTNESQRSRADISQCNRTVSVLKRDLGTVKSESRKSRSELKELNRSVSEMDAELAKFKREMRMLRTISCDTKEILELIQCRPQCVSVATQTVPKICPPSPRLDHCQAITDHKEKTEIIRRFQDGDRINYSGEKFTEEEVRQMSWDSSPENTYREGARVNTAWGSPRHSRSPRRSSRNQKDWSYYDMN